MQVKKFEAPTMQEALNVIKRELGPEAVILSTKQNRSGFGLMSKASVEVTVAVSEKDLKKKHMAEKMLPQAVKEKIWSQPAAKQSEIYDNYFEKQLKRVNKERIELNATTQEKMARTQKKVEEVREQAQQRREQQQRGQQQREQMARQATQRTAAPMHAANTEQGMVRPMTGKRYADITDDDDVGVAKPNYIPAQARATAAAVNASAASDKVRNLEQDIAHLKTVISDLSNSRSSSVSTRDEWDTNPASNDAIASVLQDLVGSGVEKKYARQLVKEATFELSSQEQNDESIVQEKLAMLMMKEIRVADLLQNVGASSGKSTSTVIALVGPTGVGKTTTIAKIASQAILEKRLRVGLINLDSYKVAAADQLSTYAKIMNVPFRSVTTPDELQQAVYDFGSLDLVLIDTTGRSQKDQESLLQLRHTLAGIEDIQSVLLMSAATRDSDMNDIAGRFKIFEPVGLVFSKLDETSVYGCVYNTQKRTGLPLLYFTVGQRVPEDIERASAERVVDLILDL